MQISKYVDKNNLKDIINIALPMVVSQGTYMAMIFTDRFFMSDFGPEALAATMAGGLTAFLTNSLIYGMLSYGNALVANYFGAGKLDKCSLVITQGLIIAALIAPIVYALSFFIEDLFLLVGHPPSQIILEKKYYSVLVAGALFPYLKTALTAFFSGIGKTKVIMLCNFLAMAINIPFSYILIFGLYGFSKMGIEGAAYATILSSFISFLAMLGFYLGPKNFKRFQIKASFRFDPEIAKTFLKFGFPSGLETFLNVAAFNLYVLLFQSYGATEGAAVTIVFNWDMVCFIPLVGLQIAVMSLIGRYHGAKDEINLNKTIGTSLLTAMVYGGSLAIIFLLLRSELIDIFKSDHPSFKETKDLAMLMMPGMASYCVIDGLLLVMGGVLRGAGDTKWLMFTSVSLHWLMVIAQIWIIKYSALSPLYSWYFFVAFVMVVSISYAFRLKSGKWRNINIA